MFNSKLSQLVFVKFPIFFPLFYCFILYSFPNFEKALIILTILFLAETHFAATWPFFLDKVNHQFIKEKKNELIFLPIIIIVTSLLAFFFLKSIFLLVFFAANIYHVTRQSYGICKLYSKNEKEFKFQKNLIYLVNFIFFLIAIIRFNIPIFEIENILFLNLVIIAAIFLISLYYILKFKFSENFLCFITGCLIFYPICFVNSPVHAIIMGVTMHYTQYLFLTSYVYKKRNESNFLSINKNFFNRFLIIIFLYSITMTILSSLGFYNNQILNQLIIIPIIGQMLHFYLDSQIWKFSVKNNRENVLKYLSGLLS